MGKKRPITFLAIVLKEERRSGVAIHLCYGFSLPSPNTSLSRFWVNIQQAEKTPLLPKGESSKEAAATKYSLGEDRRLSPPSPERPLRPSHSRLSQ